MTKYKEAKQEFRLGNYDKAWEIAKSDETLSPNATKEKWLSFMAKVIVEEVEQHLANENLKFAD